MAVTQSFTDQQASFAMIPEKKIEEQPKISMSFPNTFQTFMGASKTTQIQFEVAPKSSIQEKLNYKDDDEDEDDGERTPPKQMVKQRGMFSGFQNQKLSFKHKVFAEDK